LRKGIAVAVETKNPFCAGLVENSAASSIRWNGEPPPPQIGAAYSRTNRLKQFPILKAAKPKVDDGDLYSSIKKALDRAETEDPSLKSICNRLKKGLVFMPRGSAHITYLRLTELEKIFNVLASLAPEPGRPIHALYIRVDSEAHRGCCGYNCFGELNSLVEVNLGMTCEFYFQHRYNWYTYGGFVRFAQKACSKGVCWLYEACAILTFIEKLEKETIDLGKGLQQILQIYQPGHEEVCAVCLHGSIPKEQLAVVKVVAKNAIAQVSDEWTGCVEALGFTSTLTRRQYEIGAALY
jgi:hypothetical protein